MSAATAVAAVHQLVVSQPPDDSVWLAVITVAQRSVGSMCNNLEGCRLYLDSQLHRAARANKADYVGLLIGRGADVASVDDASETPLLACTRWPYCSMQAAEVLLRHGASVDGMCGSVALMRAVRHDSPELVKLLIAYGVDLNVTDAAKSTILHVAAKYGRRHIVSLLLDSGAASLQNLRRETPKDVALHYGHVDTARILP